MSYLKNIPDKGNIANESLLNPNKNPVVKFLRRLHILGDGSNLGKLNQFSHMNVDGRITVLNDHQEEYGKNTPPEEVSADKLYTHLIYDGKQLETNDEIVKAIYSCNRDTSDLYIKIPKFVDVLKQNNLDKLSGNLSDSDFDGIAKKIKSLMVKHFGANLLEQFTFKGEPKKLDKIEALQDFTKPVNQLKRNMGIDLGRMYGQAKLLGKNKAIDPQIRKVVSEILLAIVNKYYTFYVHVFHWMIRSFKASAEVSNESVVEGPDVDEYTLLETKVKQIADTKKEISTHQIIDETQDDEANVYIKEISENGKVTETKLPHQDGDSFTKFSNESDTSLASMLSNLYTLSLEDDDDKEDTSSDEESSDNEGSDNTDKEDKDEDTDSEDDSTDEASEDETTDADTEEDTETTEEDDPDSEGEDTEETDEESSEEPEERREEVELDNPDLEKSKIKEYLSPLIGEENLNQLYLYTSGEVNRPLYHISMNPNIVRFTPKVSKRTLSKEDRSIPRISTSTSLVGCINGYQSIVSDMDGRAAKKFDGIFTVYELPYQYAIKPAKTLLQDVDISDEYWLVSWKKETYVTEPNIIATFTVPKMEKVYGSDGIDYTWHIYAKVKKGVLYIDHQRKLNEGYYHIILNGYNFKYPLKNNNLIEVETITENDYNKVTSLSMMIKTR